MSEVFEDKSHCCVLVKMLLKGKIGWGKGGLGREASTLKKNNQCSAPKKT